MDTIFCIFLKRFIVKKKEIHTKRNKLKTVVKFVPHPGMAFTNLLKTRAGGVRQASETGNAIRLASAFF